MKTKKIIAAISEEQFGYFDFKMPCPKCGISIITNTDSRAHMSMRAPCLICEVCHSKEVFEDLGMLARVGKLKEWAAVRKERTNGKKASIFYPLRLSKARG